MFDEPSSYLDVKQRLKCALTIRSLLSDDRYGDDDDDDMTMMIINYYYDYYFDIIITIIITENVRNNRISEFFTRYM